MLTGKKLRAYLAYAVHGIETPPERKPPVKAKRAGTRRGPARDADYRAWVRSFPCCVCQSPHNVEAAHTDALQEPSARGGMSMKHSDFSCIPLCHDCHQARPDSYHRIRGGRAAFEARHAISCARVVADLLSAWKAA
jgi:hypothetical protein